MILDKFSLKGKVAVVTGANTGLGQGICWAFAEAGAKIVGVGRSDMTETGDYIRSLGGEFFEIKADLLSSDCVLPIIDGAIAHYGRIDILVNNAGIIRRDDLENYSVKDWDDVMNTNIRTLFFLSQEAGRRMIAQGEGGKIINIASMLSYQGGIRVPAYTASKSAVLGLTREMANEWAKYNINVNAIAPGYMVTNNTAALRADEKRSAEILGRIPAGKWGSPEDIGGAAVFLASEAANYIHGFTIAVDGGWLAR
ncbi:MAG: 2-dehydro-3-deoxy-D-gluconate 5-dehydrogenase KduD [Oscillospiraceae bacterium]|nr:2-dehydro-3-deoxy-D-gluconate 5-dehydrogenase KduD [Oscillospiraceae bacterium]